MNFAPGAQEVAEFASSSHGTQLLWFSDEQDFSRSGISHGKPDEAKKSKMYVVY